MKPRDGFELLLLAALWGASFLFMRLGAADFGPFALAALRATGAVLLLVPLLALRGRLGELRCRWRPLLVVGLFNSALPFLFFGYAALSIGAGLASIFNATSPLFAAVVARVWLGERLTRLRVAGLAIGFGGVAWLALHGAQDSAAAFAPGGSGRAIAAYLCATACYSLVPSYTQRFLGGTPPLAVAAGSQLAATLLLAAPAVYWWPQANPAPRAWAGAALLAVASTGFAYLLYFRLIARIGGANAIAVTFLIPLFAMLWAGLLLHEAVTPAMAAGGAVILCGTALATGLLGRRTRPARV